MCEEVYISNPSTCTCLKSNIGDAVITCDEIIEQKKWFSYFNNKKCNI